MKRITIMLLTAVSLSLVTGNAGAAGHSPQSHPGLTSKSQAQQNSNGILSAGRDKGLQRAEDRRHHVKNHGESGK